MTKKLILRFLLLIFIPAVFSSCRTDDAVQQEAETERQKIEAFRRFENNMASQKKLQKNSSEYISYHEPFKKIIQDFMDNNPSYSQRFHDEVGDVYFDLRSFTYGEMTKGLAYPIMKNGTVNGVLIGLVNPERDWVNFIVLKNNSSEVQSMISKFKNFYNSPSTVSRGREQMQEEQIEEVVIVVYDGIPGPSYMYYQPYTDYGNSGGLGGEMSGGPVLHGGGGSSQSGNSKNPCEKLKSQTLNPNFKAKINTLESNLDKKKETGYVEKTNGSFEYKDNASATEDTNSLTLGDPTPDMKGYMHTHPNDFEDSEGNMRIGFKIFSPADVIYFNQMISNAQANGTPLDDIYAVMVSGKGNYQIRFTGNANQIKTTYTNTKTEYREMYKTYFKENAKRSDETNFLKFMEEKMYVKGVSLVKMEKDGTIIKKTLNSTKTGVADNPCS